MFTWGRHVTLQSSTGHHFHWGPRYNKPGRVRCWHQTGSAHGHIHKHIPCYIGSPCPSRNPTIACSWIAHTRNGCVLWVKFWNKWQTERIMSRVYLTSKWGIFPRWRIRGNTRSAQFSMLVGSHQGRYGVEIKTPIWWQTCSWVRIVNGINKYVTETSETICFERVEHRVIGKPFAKARPRQTSNLTLSPVSVPHRERKWIDIEPGKFDKSCLEVWKLMISSYHMTIQYVEKMMEQ